MVGKTLPNIQNLEHLLSKAGSDADKTALLLHTAFEALDVVEERSARATERNTARFSDSEENTLGYVQEQFRNLGQFELASEMVSTFGEFRRYELEIKTKPSADADEKTSYHTVYVAVSETEAKKKMSDSFVTYLADPTKKDEMGWEVLGRVTSTEQIYDIVSEAKVRVAAMKKIHDTVSEATVTSDEELIYHQRLGSKPEKIEDTGSCITEDPDTGRPAGRSTGGTEYAPLIDTCYVNRSHVGRELHSECELTGPLDGPNRGYMVAVAKLPDPDKK